jgi:hypothetical protein
MVYRMVKSLVLLKLILLDKGLLLHQLEMVWAIPMIRLKEIEVPALMKQC